MDLSGVGRKRHRVLDRRRRSERGSSHLKRCTVHLRCDEWNDLGVTPCALPLKWKFPQMVVREDPFQMRRAPPRPPNALRTLMMDLRFLANFWPVSNLSFSSTFDPTPIDSLETVPPFELKLPVFQEKFPQQKKRSPLPAAFI